MTNTQNQFQTPKSNPNIYFAYGSNLSLEQMRNRCPGSAYYGFGTLHGYRWLINERGYANIVRSPSSSLSSFVGRGGGEGRSLVQERMRGNGEKKEREEEKAEETEDRVEGMLYTLTAEDEGGLDAAEGVPWVYEKHILPIELLTPRLGVKGGVGGEMETVDALVYVDVERIVGGEIKEEYINRMNRGIRDARGKGMNDGYIDNVLRNWIPAPRESGNGEAEGKVQDPFLWQARGEGKDIDGVREE